MRLFCLLCFCVLFASTIIIIIAITITTATATTVVHLPLLLPPGALLYPTSWAWQCKKNRSRSRIPIRSLSRIAFLSKSPKISPTSHNRPIQSRGAWVGVARARYWGRDRGPTYLIF
uniref:Uncharacterized protein n=1 Tax=Anopheles darlingi TaxID=43151 RepID=A0A2M4D7L3_ANODA